MAAPSSDVLLHCRVVEARDLSAADPNGYSDPYVKLKLVHTDNNGKDSKDKSHIINRSLNPVWNWDASLRIPAGSSGDLVLEVLDNDELVADDFLGALRMTLGSLMAKPVSGGWFRLRDKKGEGFSHGRVFVVFAVDRTADAKKGRSQEERDSILFYATQQVVQELADDSAASSLAELSVASVSPSAASAASSTPSSASGEALPLISQLSLFVGTWNVGNEPPSDDLTSWLWPEELGGIQAREQGRGHDLVLIGVQECKYDVASSKDSVSVVDHLRATSGHFQAVLERNLNGGKLGEEGGQYVLLKLSEMMEIRLFLFIRRDKVIAGGCSLDSLVDGIVTAVEATGLGGVVGNKGGAAMLLRLEDTHVGFVTAHLAAHQDKSARRNADAREILANLKLNRRNLDALACSRLLFFCGDLNYRLDYAGQGDAQSPTPEQFEAFLAKITSDKREDLRELAATDQLRAAQKDGAVFPLELGWEEGDFTAFQPTFKVKRNSRLEYTTQRSPAWCDRVLYRVGQIPASQDASLRAQLSPELKGYGSAPLVGSSDHKPVWSSFRVPLRRMPLSTDYTRGALSIRFLRVALRELTVAPPPNALLKFFSPMLVRSVETKLKGSKSPATPSGNQVADIPAACALSDIITAVAGGSAASSAFMWEGPSDFPLVHSLVNNPARLRTQPLVLKVLVEQEVSHIERLWATAEVDLALGCGEGKEGKAVEFDAPLLFGGVKTGRVTGSFVLEWAPLKTPCPAHSREHLQKI